MIYFLVDEAIMGIFITIFKQHAHDGFMITLIKM